MRGGAKVWQRAVRIISLVVVMSLSAGAFAGSSWLAQFEGQPLPPYVPPAVREVVLPNGLTCFLLEDHTLPVVHLSVIIRTGALYEEKGKQGLAKMTATLMEIGGAGSLSPEAFDERRDRLGITLHQEVGTEMSQFHLRSLSNDLAEALPLFFDMLFSPRFSGARMKTAKGNFVEALHREDDDPSTVADRAFFETVYGPKSPWGRRATPHTVSRLKRGEVLAFHQQFFVPGNMILAASGDFSTKALLEQITTATQNVPQHSATFPSIPPVPLVFSPRERNIERSLNQSFIRVGHLGIRRDNPDRFAVTLMNAILGAPIFKSRLMEDIRTKRGLAYGVASSFAPAKDYGVFVVRVATKSNSTDEVIDLIANHVATMSDGVSSKELAFAKEAILNQQVFAFDTAAKVALQQSLFRFYGYPSDYWRLSRKATERVTESDVRQAARSYLHPEGLVKVIVGPRRGGR